MMYDVQLYKMDQKQINFWHVQISEIEILFWIILDFVRD